MITIVNKYSHVYCKYCFNTMRPSILGNPFSHMENTRAQFKVATHYLLMASSVFWSKKNYCATLD